MLTTVDVALVVFLGKELLVVTSSACAFKGFRGIADVPACENVVIEMFFAGQTTPHGLHWKSSLMKPLLPRRLQRAAVLSMVR